HAASLSALTAAYPGSLASMPAAPAVAALHAFGKLLALLGREHLGGIGERLREPLAAGVCELDLLGTQPLDRGAIYACPGEYLDRLLARGLRLLAQRREVLRRALGDCGEFVLLLGAGIHLGSEVFDHALDALVHLRRVRRHAVAPVSGAAMGKAFSHVAAGQACDQRDHQRENEAAAVSVAISAAVPGGALIRILRLG